MKSAGSLIADLLLKVLDGQMLPEAIKEEMDSQKNPYVRHSFTKWLDDPDEWVIGPRFSTACYVEDSVPAVIYLAMKYHQDPEKALIANTNLGGDNAARGAVLGALLGAALGIEKFPDPWVKGLLEPLPDMLPVSS